MNIRIWISPYGGHYARLIYGADAWAQRIASEPRRVRMSLDLFGCLYVAWTFSLDAQVYSLKPEFATIEDELFGSCEDFVSRSCQFLDSSGIYIQSFNFRHSHKPVPNSPGSLHQLTLYSCEYSFLFLFSCRCFVSFELNTQISSISSISLTWGSGMVANGKSRS